MNSGLDVRVADASTIPDPLAKLAELSLENHLLRQRLDSLLLEARLNQEKMRRFDQFERELIAAPSLGSLIQSLLLDYRDRFQLDAVTLAWLDPQCEVPGMLPERLLESLSANGLLLWGPSNHLPDHLALTGQPVLTAWESAHAVFFEGVSQPLGSIALLPLVHQGQWLGSLNLGSRDPQRFATGTRADFLARLGSLVAVCLHSAMVTERLKQAGLTDALTSLNNRRYFEARCLEEVQSARRSGAPLVCMFLDLDGFKQLNDRHGHPAGDAVLRYVARLIKVQLRGGDVVARYGGEEFVVLLPDTALARGVETAERIRRVVAAQSVPLTGDGSGPDVRVTLSIGVSLLECPSLQTPVAELASALVARADQALYQAKSAGRNRVMALAG